MTLDDARPTTAADPAALSDADLVLRTRSGDRSAFAELWRRHYPSGLAVARGIISTAEPATVVEDAYARIYRSIRAGRGPTGSFRAYLFSSIRVTAAVRGWPSQESALDHPSPNASAAAEALGRGVTHRAFGSLPSRWQEVLWYSEIERLTPAEIAPLLALAPREVAELTLRARDGLREAWIAAHQSSLAEGSPCQWAIARLSAHARRTLGRRDHGHVDRHLAECLRCAIVADQAKEVSPRLALVLVPLTIGVTGGAAYLAALQLGRLPLVDASAMPGTVTREDAPVRPRAIAAGGATYSPRGAGRAGGGRILTRVGVSAGLVAIGLVAAGTAAAVSPALAPWSIAAQATGVTGHAASATDEGEADAGASRWSPSPSDLPSAEPVAPTPEDASSSHAAEGTGRDAPSESGTVGSGTNDSEGDDPAPPTPGDTVANDLGLLGEAPAIVGSSSIASPSADEIVLSISVTGAPGATVQARVRGTVVAVETIDGSGRATLTIHLTIRDLATDPRLELRYAVDGRLGVPIGIHLSAVLT